MPNIKCPECGTCATIHPQCRYAMAALLRRLDGEGYVVKDRRKELTERARNLEHGRGFVTNASLENDPTDMDLLA